MVLWLCEDGEKERPRVGGIDAGHERAFPDYAAARHSCVLDAGYCVARWDSGELCEMRRGLSRGVVEWFVVWVGMCGMGGLG